MAITKYSDEFVKEVEGYFLNNKEISCRDLGKIFNISKDMALKIMQPHIEPKTLKKFNREFFREIDTEEKAYWLGFSVGDASISFLRNGGSYEITLCEEDKSHLEKFIKSLESEHCLKRREIKLKGYDKIHVAYRLILCGYEFTKDLERRGCIERKSLTKTFPTEEQCPKEFLRHYIRGYVDANGSIGNTVHEDGRITNQYFQLDSSVYFLEGMIKYIEELIPESKDTMKIYYKENSKGTSMRTTPTIAKKLIKYLYSDCSVYLDRKYEKIKYLLKD